MIRLLLCGLALTPAAVSVSAYVWVVASAAFPVLRPNDLGVWIGFDLILPFLWPNN